MPYKTGRKAAAQAAFLIKRYFMMDYYQILKVSRNADGEEIKKAHRKLSRKYHPDNAGEQSRKQFEQVQEAYGVLGDEEKRAAYDRSLTGNTQGESKVPPGKKGTQKVSPNYADMTAFYSGSYQNSFEKFFGFKPNSKGK